MAKIATRDAYGKTLAQLCEEREDIVVLDADLSGSTKSGVMKKWLLNVISTWGLQKET